jgi:hypothetical protein
LLEIYTSFSHLNWHNFTLVGRVLQFNLAIFLSTFSRSTEKNSNASKYQNLMVFRLFHDKNQVKMSENFVTRVEDLSEVQQNSENSQNEETGRIKRGKYFMSYSKENFKAAINKVQSEETINSASKSAQLRVLQLKRRPMLPHPALFASFLPKLSTWNKQKSSSLSCSQFQRITRFKSESCSSPANITSTHSESIARSSRD